MSAEPTSKACAVCGRGLIAYQHGTETAYEHTEWDLTTGEAVDHPPVPVDLDSPQARLRCDFCLAEEPGWVLPVAPLAPPSPGQVGHSADWLACAECIRLIETNQWNGLLRRAVEAWEARHQATCPTEVLHGIASLYRQVRRNVTGAPRALARGT